MKVKLSSLSSSRMISTSTPATKKSIASFFIVLVAVLVCSFLGSHHRTVWNVCYNFKYLPFWRGSNLILNFYFYLDIVDWWTHCWFINKKDEQSYLASQHPGSHHANDRLLRRYVNACNFGVYLCNTTIYVPVVNHCWKVELFNNGTLEGDLNDIQCLNIRAGNMALTNYRKISQFDYVQRNKVFFKNLPPEMTGDGRGGWSGSIDFIKNKTYVLPTVTRIVMNFRERQFDVDVSLSDC